MTRTKLTNGTKNSFTIRSGFSADSDYSIGTAHRDPSSEAQGTHSESSHEGIRRVTSFERALSATAVDSQAGGAPQSKWTRKSRPWNVSDSTAVVASRSIREAWLSPDSTGSTQPETLARSSKGASCGQVAREGSRILDSPVQSASGRGRSRGRLLLFV